MLARYVGVAVLLGLGLGGATVGLDRVVRGDRGPGWVGGAVAVGQLRLQRGRVEASAREVVAGRAKLTNDPAAALGHAVTALAWGGEETRAAEALLREGLVGLSRAPLRHGEHAVVAAAAAGELLYTLADDGLRVWDPEAIGRPVIHVARARGHRLLAVQAGSSRAAAVGGELGPRIREVGSGPGPGVLEVWDLRARTSSVVAMEEPVAALWFAGRGDVVATLAGGRARAWGLAGASLQPLATLSLPRGAVYSLAADGALIVADAGGRVSQWEPGQAGLRAVGELPFAARSVTGCVAAGGRRRVVASGGSVAAVIGPGRVMVELGGHRGEVERVVVDAECRTAATVDAARTIRLWELGADDPGLGADVLLGVPGSLIDLRFAGAAVLAADASGELYAWDRERRGARPVRLRVDGSLVEIAWSRDGRWGLWRDADGRARVIDRAAPAGDGGSLRLSGHAAEIAALAQSRDGRSLLMGGRDGQATLWRIEPSAPPVLRARLTGHGEAILAVALAPDGARAATGGLDGQVRVWSLGADGVRESVGLTPRGGPVLGLAIDAAGVVAASSDGLLRWWSEPGATPRTVALADEATGVALVDGVVLASTRDGALLRWAPGSEPPLRRIGWAAPRTGIVLSGGRWLAACGSSGAVELWDLRDVAAGPRVFAGLRGPLRALAVSADGTWLAGTDARSSFVANVQDGRWQALSGPGAGPLVFAPDGRRLFGGRADGTIVAWSTTELAAEATTLVGHATRVSRLLVAGDGGHLVSAGIDEGARVWPLSSPWLVALARRRLAGP